MFQLNRKNVLIILGLLFAASLLLFCVLNPSQTGTFFSRISSALSPIVTGLAIAFVLNIPMKKLENVVFGKLTRKNGRIWRKLKRPVCLALSVLFVLGILAIVFYMIIPQVTNSVMTLAENLPQQAEALRQTAINLLEKFHIPTDQFKDSDIDWNKISQTLIKFITDNSFTVITSTVNVVSWITNFVLSFTFAIYLLGGKEKIGSQTLRLIKSVFPEKVYVPVLGLARLTSDSFEKFIGGQCTEAVVIGVLCFIGMSVFHMPYALMISCLIAVTALIPIVGAFAGTAVGAFLILLSDPMMAVWFVVFIIVLQQIESNLIYPRVVGSSVGLPGIWVLASVTVGGSLFGIAGMFISVPLCAVLYCLLRTAVNTVTAKTDSRRAAAAQYAAEAEAEAERLNRNMESSSGSSDPFSEQRERTGEGSENFSETERNEPEDKT